MHDTYVGCHRFEVRRWQVQILLVPFLKHFSDTGQQIAFLKKQKNNLFWTKLMVFLYRGFYSGNYPICDITDSTCFFFQNVFRKCGNFLLIFLWSRNMLKMTGLLTNPNKKVTNGFSFFRIFLWQFPSHYLSFSRAIKYKFSSKFYRLDHIVVGCSLWGYSQNERNKWSSETLWLTFLPKNRF